MGSQTRQSLEKEAVLEQGLPPHSPRAPRANGTFHLKGEPGPGELQCSQERGLRATSGRRAAEPPMLPTSPPRHFLPNRWRAPCFLSPDPKLGCGPGTLQRPGRQTPSQETLPLAPGHRYFPTHPGLSCPTVLGAHSHHAPWHPQGVLGLGSQRQQIRGGQN